MAVGKVEGEACKDAGKVEEGGEMKFEIIGTPRGKGRPRIYNAGKFVKTYTPKETASYENLVKLSYCQVAGKIKRPETDRDIALAVKIVCLFEIPASWSKKKAAIAEYCTKKPDCDNIAKIILDALNGIAFHDDSQVAILTIEKKYVKGVGAKCIVEINELYNLC